MPSPFPGMDPYLERPSLWHGFHTFLIASIAMSLAPRVAPRYYVDVEERTYLLIGEDRKWLGIPDVAVVRSPGATSVLRESPAAVMVRDVVVQVPVPEQVRERYLVIRDTASHEVVTVIEILSPANKQSGEGRRQYEEKRGHVLASLTSLVEIDLLRGGDSMPIVATPSSHYRLLVSRAWERPNAHLYPFNLNESIPEIPIPLRSGESEPTLALGTLVTQVYDQARYDLRIDYTSEPDPPLDPATATWAHDLLHQAAQRKVRL